MKFNPKIKEAHFSTCAFDLKEAKFPRLNPRQDEKIFRTLAKLTEKKTRRATLFLFHGRNQREKEIKAWVPKPLPKARAIDNSDRN